MTKKTNKAGYKKPPESGRWKKGQSGNPSGKKKPKAVPEQPILEAIAQQLRKPIELTQGGETASVPLLTALVMKLMRDMLSAPLKENLAALTMLEKLGAFNFHKTVLEADPANDDEPLIDEEVKRLLEFIEKRSNGEGDDDDASCA